MLDEQERQYERQIQHLKQQRILWVWLAAVGWVALVISLATEGK